MFWLCLCSPRVCPALLRTAEAGKDAIEWPWGWLSSWGTGMKEPVGDKCSPHCSPQCSWKITSGQVQAWRFSQPPSPTCLPPAWLPCSGCPPGGPHCRALLCTALQFAWHAPHGCVDAGTLSSSFHSLQHLSWCKLCMFGCRVWELHWPCNCYAKSKKAFCYCWPSQHKSDWRWSSPISYTLALHWWSASFPPSSLPSISLLPLPHYRVRCRKKIIES